MSATPSLASSPPHREALVQAPLERILVETDAPVDHSGKPSEPVEVLTTIRLLADAKGLSEEEITEATAANARSFLGL